MLRIESEQTEIPAEVTPRHLAEGEGLLFLAMLAGSWAVAIGVGWVIWRLAPF